MKPINNHVLLEPIEHSEFVASLKGLYDEAGVVMAVADGVDLPVGSIVYFDSWLIAKYPVPGDTSKQHWLVRYEDIRAYTVPE